MLLCIAPVPFCSSVLNAEPSPCFCHAVHVRRECLLPCSWTSCLRLPSYSAFPLRERGARSAWFLSTLHFCSVESYTVTSISVRSILSFRCAAVSIETVKLLKLSKSRRNTLLFSSLFCCCEICFVFLITRFFADIFASCVVSDPFELRLLRVHPFSFDETFVFPCSLLPRISCCPSSRNGRERISVYWQNTSDTLSIFWTHLLNRDIVTDNIQMNKMSMSIQSIAAKKSVCEIWRSSTRQTRHTSQIFRYYAVRVFVEHFRKNKIETISFGAMTYLDGSHQFSCMIRELWE